MPMLKRRKGEKKSAQAVRTEMTAMKKGQLHSGSKSGPKVTNPKQAIAIGLSEARKAGSKSAGPKPGSVAAYKKKSNKDAHRLKRNIGRK